jgi:hypothetical protein
MDNLDSYSPDLTERENTEGTNPEKNKTSEIWKYFRKIETNENSGYHNIQKVRCIVDPMRCFQILKVNDGSTSSLWKHLKSKHRGKYQETDFFKIKETQTHRNNPKIDVYFSSTNYSQNSIHKMNLQLMIIKHIVKDQKPFTLVESESFRSLLKHLDPNCSIPSADTIKRQIYKIFQEKQEQMKMYLKQNDSMISLTTDIWTSKNMKSYISLTRHFIDDKFRLQSCTLDLAPFDCNHTGINIAKTIYDVLKNWELREKFLAITTDNASNNETMVSHLEKLFNEDGFHWDSRLYHFRCMAHIIHLAVEESLKELEDKIHKIRNVCKAIRSSPIRMNAFQEKCCITNTEFKKPLIDCPTRWSSTYLMLNRAIELKKVIHLITTDDEDERVTDMSQYEISKSEWQELEMITNFLFKFHQATQFMEKSTYPTAISVIPLLNVLLDHVEDWSGDLKSKTDSVIERAARNAREKLVKYYTKTNEMTMSILAMDPRFKLKYFEDEGFSHHDIEITRNLLKNIFKTYNQISNTRYSEELYEWNMENDLFREIIQRRRKMEEKDELDLYLQEPQQDFNTDIMHYWKNSTQIHLSRMTRDLLTIPATSTPSERQFSSCNNMLTDKRMSLDPKSVRVCQCLKSMIQFFDEVN